MRPAHEDLNGYPVAPHLTSYPRVMIHGYDRHSRSLEGLKPSTFHVLKLGRLQRVCQMSSEYQGSFCVHEGILEI